MGHDPPHPLLLEASAIRSRSRHWARVSCSGLPSLPLALLCPSCARKRWSAGPRSSDARMSMLAVQSTASPSPPIEWPRETR